MVGLDRVNEIRSRVQANIEVLWVHDHVLDGATDTVHGACDDPHPHASDRLDLRDLTGLDFLVPRIHHLVRLWEVHPKLEAAHAMPVDFRHLLVDDPAPGCHPLDVAGADDPLVPEAVLVLHSAVQHVRDRFDPAVRMPREASHIFSRVLRPEIVEEKKRVEARHLRGAEGPMQMHACTFDRRASRQDLFDAARSRRGSGVVLGHSSLLVRRFPLKLAPRFASWTFVRIVDDHGGTPAWSSPRGSHFSGSLSPSPPRGSSGPFESTVSSSRRFLIWTCIGM